MRGLSTGVLLALCAAGRAQEAPPAPLPVITPPTRGTLVVSGSARLESGAWLRPSPTADGVILLEGLQDVTLDLTGASLHGRSEPLELDWCRGRAVVLRDCTGVTLRGGSFTGYQTGIQASRCRGLVIEGATFDGLLTPRLRSTVAIGSEEDRLVPPRAEDGAWPENLGTAIRLEDCDDVLVRGCTVRRSPAGVLATRSTGVRVRESDLSFLSAWGVGLFDCQGCTVALNRLDFCLRGYSRGFYSDGQGSAAILVLGSGAGHLVAKNSAVGSGVGLWLEGPPERGPAPLVAAAEEDQRTLVFGNDFSGAATDGVRLADVAGVWIVGNSIVEPGAAGLQASRVQDLVVGDNTVTGVRGAAVALEDARDVLVIRNVLHQNEVGLEVWTSEERLDREARGEGQLESADLWIDTNSFASNDSDLGLRDLRGVRMKENVFDVEGRELFTSELVPAPGVPALLLENRDPETGAELPGRLDLKNWLRGVGAWLPSGHVVRCELCQPDAAAHPLREAFLSFSEPDLGPGELPPAGERPPVRKVVGEWGPWDFEREREPSRLRQPGGVLRNAFWEASWFRWDESTDPRGGPARLEAWRELAREPVLSDVVDVWATPWGEDAARRELVGDQSFGLIATTQATLRGGKYRLTCLSDDGLRLSIDGTPALEVWTWHPARTDTVELELSPGEHAFRLEYFQIDGPATLMIDLDRLPDE